LLLGVAVIFLRLGHRRVPFLLIIDDVEPCSPGMKAEKIVSVRLEPLDF
jgi:hypothetical protein